MKYFGCGSFSAFILTLFLSTGAVSAAGVVTSVDEAALRAAMAGGGTVTFDCDGTVTLSNTLAITSNTVMDASGHSIILSGNGSVRVFSVPTGVSLSLLNLTIANGNNTGTNGNLGGLGQGGGIWSAGILNITGCFFETNTVIGGSSASSTGPFGGGNGGDALGGAIYLAGGDLNAINCNFMGNSVSGGAGGTAGTASGGAIYNDGGLVNLENCNFCQNNATGGMGNVAFSAMSGSAFGGALYNLSGTSIVTDCSFTMNSGSSLLPEYLEDSGGLVCGGAIYNTNGLVSLSQSLFATNSATGGSGLNQGYSEPGSGGAIFNAASLVVTNCEFFGNSATGGQSGPVGPDGQGGAIYNGSLAVVISSLFSNNEVVAGSSYRDGVTPVGPDGIGRGGAIYNSSNFIAQANTFYGNVAYGGGSAGGDATGGAIFNSGSCSVTNNTLTANSTKGGNASPGGPAANGYGGAVFNANGTFLSANNTIAGNSAEGGSGIVYEGMVYATNGAGYGGGIVSSNGTCILINTIVANNTNGGDGFGVITDGSHNLESDSTCNFANTGSLNNTDPKLAPLDNYGGPTPTMALLADSPAIDGGDDANFPATDQRGRARPYGAAPDIGAFESSPPYVIRGTISGATLREEVSVTAGSSSASATNHGNYSLEGLAANTYVLSPQSANYLFLPANRSVTVGPDQLNVDFKAYHWNELSLDGATNNILHLVFAGTNGQTYRVLASTNFTQWSPVLTNTMGPDEYFEVFLPINNVGQQFYRTANP